MIDGNLQNVIELHNNFWKRQNTQHITQLTAHPNWSRKPYPIKDSFISDATLINATDININEFLTLDKPLGKINLGNKLNCDYPAYPQSWMSGMIGCPIYATDVSCSARSEISGDVLEHIRAFDIKKALNSPWNIFLKKCIDEILVKCKGEYPTSQFHYRGIIDMLAAYLSETELCYAVYDYEEEILNLAEKFTDLYIQIAKYDIEKRGLWNSGQVVSWGIYAPGEFLSYQIDASTLFSAKQYEKMFLKYDDKILSEFEYNITHIHYTELHIVECLAKIASVKSVQINLDREAAPDWQLEKIIEACKKLQEHNKNILITGELNECELSKLKNETNAEGMMIFYWHPLD